MLQVKNLSHPQAIAFLFSLKLTEVSMGAARDILETPSSSRQREGSFLCPGLGRQGVLGRVVRTWRLLFLRTWGKSRSVPFHLCSSIVLMANQPSPLFRGPPLFSRVFSPPCACRFDVLSVFCCSFLGHRFKKTRNGRGSCGCGVLVGETSAPSTISLFARSLAWEQRSTKNMRLGCGFCQPVGLRYLSPLSVLLILSH
jgi:hypothetical protein